MTARSQQYWQTYGAPTRFPPWFASKLRSSVKESHSSPNVTDDDAEWLARLVRAGVARPGEGPIPADLLKSGPRVGPFKDSVLDALLEERREGR